MKANYLNVRWGDKSVALIAQSFLEANVRQRLNALLAAHLTPHDIGSSATWADKLRDPMPTARGKRPGSGIR